MCTGDLSHLPLVASSVDLVVARSVFEHLKSPADVIAECARVLRPGGALLVLTPNRWDYATVVARLVPNRWHARLVAATEGRSESDTFPTFYRSNTPSHVRSHARHAGLLIEAIEFINQYPNYLQVNRMLFLLGTGYERVTSRFETLRHLRSWLLITMRRPGPDPAQTL